MKVKKFKEPDALNDVGEFHELFDLPVVEKPVIPDEKRCKLRIALLEEELSELKEAIEKKDIVAVADAFCDLQYVLSGAILEFGMASKFKKLFEEVQRSNMSKACKTYEDAVLTRDYYWEHKNTLSHIVEKNGEYLVYREEDKKVLKNINYIEADLKKILFKD